MQQCFQCLTEVWDGQKQPHWGYVPTSNKTFLITQVSANTQAAIACDLENSHLWSGLMMNIWRKDSVLNRDEGLRS